MQSIDSDSWLKDRISARKKGFSHRYTYWVFAVYHVKNCPNLPLEHRGAIPVPLQYKWIGRGHPKKLEIEENLVISSVVDNQVCVMLGGFHSHYVDCMLGRTANNRNLNLLLSTTTTILYYIIIIIINIIYYCCIYL